MKKIAWFCVVITLLLAIIMGVWVTFNSLYKVQQNRYTYFRFTKTTDDNAKKFNGWGILSPIQVEKQKLVSATKTIQKRISFPVSPKFKIIKTNEAWENYIVKEIVRVADSARKTVYDYHFNYDHTSKDVRNFTKPKELKVPHYVLYINLKGTASPESQKDGYEKSIYPGHFEKENGRLAKERANNIAQKLEAMGYTIGEVEFSEVQLSKDDYLRALKDRTVLDKLRYVDVEINILYKRLEIETMTLPVLLPLWILLAILAVGFLFSRNPDEARLRQKNLRRFKRGWSSSGEIWGCFIIIGFFVGAILLIKLLAIGFFILVGIAIIMAAVLLCYTFGKLCEFLINAWRFIKRLPVLIKVWINNALFFLAVCLIIMILSVIIIFIDLMEWWDSLTKCQKVLLFLIPYAVAMTVWNIILHFN